MRQNAVQIVGHLCDLFIAQRQIPQLRHTPDFFLCKLHADSFFLAAVSLVRCSALCALFRDCAYNKFITGSSIKSPLFFAALTLSARCTNFRAIAGRKSRSVTSTSPSTSARFFSKSPLNVVSCRCQI